MPATRPDPIDDRTPLMLAACSGDLDELFDLILTGSELDKQDSRRWTALSYACWAGHYPVIQQLLDSGADPNVHEQYCRSKPLSFSPPNEEISMRCDS